VKEMIIADLLNHELIYSKHNADAHALDNPDQQYEYLSCKEGGAGQLDRMFKEPPEKRLQSLKRIERNQKICLAVFYAADQLQCKVIYELPPEVVAAEAERQLNSGKNDISHVGFSEEWARRNGISVYESPTLLPPESTLEL
jgi:hypothetical protein